MYWIAARQPYPLTLSLMNGGEGTEHLSFVHGRAVG